MAKVGRPKKDKPHVNTISINVSEDEMLAIRLISKKLGYKTISGFLRSAVSKGILLSTRNGGATFTSPKDKVHWLYLGNIWSITEHWKDLNEEEQKRLSFPDITVNQENKK
jgi:hypothetical protein